MRALAVVLGCLATSSGFAVEPSVVSLKNDAARGQSQGVVVTGCDLVYSGQLLPDTTSPDVALQWKSLTAKTAELLAAERLTTADIVKLNLSIADEADLGTINSMLATGTSGPLRPAVSRVISSLPDPQARIGLDFVAARRKPVDHPDSAPATAPGTAVVPAGATSRSFVSGQAEKGDGSVSDATRQTMASLFRTLEFLELRPADVVQVKVFITPMSQAAQSRDAIAAAFAPGRCPPLVFVEWQSPALPVEIELVAATSAPLPTSRPAVEYLTPPGMKASPVYCRVARVQSPTTVFLSGLYGSESDPDSEAELRDLFRQTDELVKAAGSDLRHLVKATYYVSSGGSSAQHNRLRPEYYDPARPPAASKAIVRGVGERGRTITWDMIAVPAK